MTYPELPTYIDSTMRSCFVSCPQKFFREFVEGYRPPGISIDLHAGGCFASGIEETYKQVHMHKKPLGDALMIAHARFMQEWGDFEVPEFKKTAKTKDRVWEAIYGDGTPKGRGYFEEYGPLTDHVQPYFDQAGKPTFEYTFAIPLEPAVDPRSMTRFDGEGYQFPTHPNGSPFLYTGRFDMLGSYMGRPVVRDEKTTGSSIGQDWAKKWDLRSQFMGYVWACQQCGIDLDTVVVRGIAIQKTQIVHSEAIKTFSKFMIDRWHEQLRRDLWRIRRAYDDRYWDYNLADACTAYGSCVFTDICQSPNAETWLKQFVVRKWNPLDKNPAKEKQDAPA